jgi:hypothetical protein
MKRRTAIVNRFEVGQEVLLTGKYHKNPKPVTVSRVGRKNAYVTIFGRETAFDRETGWEIRYANSIGESDRLMTEEMIREEDLRKAVAKRLADLGVGPVGYGGWKLSTGVLERLVAVLEEEGS